MYVVYHALWTFACFLHQSGVCMSHLSDSRGLVDLKCFQMCVGSDLLALSAAPWAWGPRSLLQPCRRPLRPQGRKRSGWHTSASPPSAPHLELITEETVRENRGKASQCLCVCVLYEKECIWVKGVVRAHVYQAVYICINSLKKKKNTTHFLLNLVLFLLSVSPWFSPFSIRTALYVLSELYSSTYALMMVENLLMRASQIWVYAKKKKKHY